MTHLSETAAHLISITLGLTFLVSALAKTRRPGPFQTVIFLLSGPFRAAYKWIGICVLCLEVLTGVCLLLGIFPLLTSILTVGMMLLFDGVLIVLRLGHPGVDCGCFGSRSGTGVTRWHLLRNLGLTVVAVALVFHLLP